MLDHEEIRYTTQSILSVPHLPEEHKLQKLFEQLLRSKRGGRMEKNPRLYYWDASHFKLDRVRFFTEATEEQQDKVLSTLSNFYLQESYFIEKSGFSFNSKMMMLSPTAEEKSLYAMFAADEAGHLQDIMSCMKTIPSDDYLHNPFLLFLGDVIRKGDRESLIFLVQVMLEGFGFAYYSGLAEGCIDPGYKKVVQGILRDEAFHHGSGLVLAKEKTSYAPKTLELMQEMIQRFLSLFQEWPHGVLAALDTTLGGLSPAQKAEVLRSIDYEAATTDRLLKVKSLVVSNATHDLIASLSKTDLFKPITIEDCVARYA